MPAFHSAAETLDREFLAMRGKLIELAAAFDRIERRQGSPGENPRWEQLHRAIALLASPEGGRAERIEMLFSLPYDPRWRAVPSP